MNKILIASMGLMLSFGSLIGYFLAKWDIQSNGVSPTQNAIAATAIDRKPKLVRLAPIDKRSELEAKYFLCTASPPNKQTLARFDDKTLNDLVYQVCTEKS